MNDWILPLAVGAATGVLSGFGVGGGTLLLVYMTAFAGVEQRLAQGINLLYFLPAGLMAQGLPEYAAGAVPALTLGNFVVKNLLPVTLGNLLGGLGLAWVYQRIYLKD